MTDTRTPEQRRRIMQAVKTKDTGPEKLVRQLLFRAGYRYRLHRKSLPGHPDIVFPNSKKAIFVNGCFWHSHGCPKGKAPKSRLDYWGPKLKANRERDAANMLQLETLGWSVLTVWQCETTITKSLATKLFRFMEGRGDGKERSGLKTQL